MDSSIPEFFSHTFPIIYLQETRLLAEVDFASSQIRGIDTAFFSTGTFFSCDVLWECLGDSNHSQAIRESLDFVTCKDSSVKQPDFTAVSRLLEFNTRLIGHLVSLAAGSASFLPSPRHGKNEHTNVLSCIRVSLFLVDSLPEFRKVEAASRSKQVGYMNALTCQHLKTLLVIAKLIRSPLFA
jgi:hypothetical protein